MKRIVRAFGVYVLVGIFVLSCILTAAGASEEKEGTVGSAAAAEAETEAGTESPAEVLEDTGEAIGQIISKGHETSVSIDILEPLQELISDAAKGTDMSWLDSVVFSGSSAGNDDGGLDASGVLTLNGTDLYHGRISIDAKHRTVYLCCPEFRKTPFKVELDKVAEAAEKAARDMSSGGSADSSDSSGSSASGAGSFRKDYMRLAKEAEEFFSSIPAEEWTGFLNRYRETFTQNLSYSYHENVTVLAGVLSETVDTTTVTADQSAMKNFLSASLDSLKEDELIRKILKSDFASDLVNTFLTDTKLGDPVDGDSLYSGYQSLLGNLTDKDLGKVPGFTLTYGLSEDGMPATLDFTILYSGAAVNLFSLKMLAYENHSAYQFDLGLLMSAFLSAKLGGDPNGETGILIETDTSSGAVHDTLTVLAAGQELGKLSLDDFTPEDVREGILSGTASLTVGDALYEAAFSHPEDGTEVITGRYNGTDYFTITAKAREVEKAKIDQISRKKAEEVYDQATWDEYIRDSNLSKMLTSLTKAGVPDDIVDTLTSGEAATEKSRENTDEVDGTGQLQNGEVGGADIGNDRAA